MPQRETWTVTVTPDPAIAVPSETMGVKRWLKFAWRCYRLRNVDCSAVDGTWTVTFEAALFPNWPIKTRIANLTGQHTAWYGLKVLSVRGIGPGGEPLGPCDLDRAEGISGPVVED
jgi:hypothetical protein